MAINWTPWFGVPIHRRLELLSVGLIVFCEIFLGPSVVCIILLLLVVFDILVFLFEIFFIKRSFESVINS